MSCTVATGYIRSFDDENELHNDDVNDILNLLTVSELREIICILKQVGIYLYSLFSLFEFPFCILISWFAFP